MRAAARVRCVRAAGLGSVAALGRACDFGVDDGHGLRLVCRSAVLRGIEPHYTTRRAGLEDEEPDGLADADAPSTLSPRVSPRAGVWQQSPSGQLEFVTNFGCGDESTGTSTVRQPGLWPLRG